MATRYYALLEKAHRAETSQVISGSPETKQTRTPKLAKPLFLCEIFKNYRDPPEAIEVLAEYHSDLDSRGLLQPEFFEELLSLGDSGELEHHLESLIVNYDLDSHLRTCYPGAIPYILGDDLKSVNFEEHRANQPEATIGSHSHITRNPSFSGSRYSSA